MSFNNNQNCQACDEPFTVYNCQRCNAKPVHCKCCHDELKHDVIVNQNISMCRGNVTGLDGIDKDRDAYSRAS